MDKTLFMQRAARQEGFTLTELMIALVLGLLVVLAATTMLLSTRSTYRTQDESTRMQESARFALELVNRVVRMAGYTNFGNGATEVPPFYTPGMTTSVAGVNNRLGTATLPNSQNSDSLSISFYGSEALTLPSGVDGAVLDCKGLRVPPDTRVTNTFFVAAKSGEEPELYCDNGDGGGPQPLIRGVESFQVLYGVARYEIAVYAPGTPPPAMTTDDIAPSILVYKRADQMGSSNAGSDWDNVKFVRIAMLIRSGTAARPDLDITDYQLFGPNYPAAGDAGVDINTNTTLFSNIERTRLRKVVSATIALRNRVSQWATLNP